MFKIGEDKTIYLTRGDIASMEIDVYGEDGYKHTFQTGDVVRFKVFEKKDCGSVVLQKDITITGETTMVVISLTKEDTKIGEVFSKPKDYWYEIEVNPETAPQTIIGYDEDGPKVLRLFPEGSDGIES